jgi:glycosyltransferase involved in cell wall biosynthesis
MKILIINYEFPPLGGGGGVASYDLAVEWAKKHQVDVLTSNFKNLPEFENMQGINVYRCPVLFRKSRDAASFISMLSYLFTGFKKGMLLVKENHYDVINTHFALPSGPLGWILGKLYKIPNVLSIHGGDIYDPSKKTSPHKNFIFKMAVKFILNKAQRIVAQSMNTKNNAGKYYNPIKSIDIIPLAFHPPVFSKTNRKKLGFASTDFILITIGRLVKRKAVDVQLEALSMLKDKSLKLIIVGDGPELNYLTEKVQELNLSDRVIFAGYAAENEKFGYLSISDLYVMTSLHEGFGIVFMEAMNFGLPIVSTNNGGQTDFLTNKENALLINVGDASECAKSIQKFMKDQQLYDNCSKNNREKVKMFYANHVAVQYEEIFQIEIVKFVK